ncbi:hypothetical protein AB1L30_12210 [Bremerella sp. JC817]|uniref:D-alanyl-D-alanine carboxypeptidase family protein n=1 Tax=Bremerella sp. JC817 TaxID=3231756 RepID=UPI003458D303
MDASFFRLLLIGTVCLGLSEFTFANDSIIRIDFGSSQRLSEAPWNNIDQPGASGMVLTNALDQTGKATSLSVRQLDPWAGFNLSGTSNHASLPASASTDSFYLEQGVDPAATLRLEGLSPGHRYRITIDASRMGGTEMRSGKYTVNNHTNSLDAKNNQGRPLMFSDVVADGKGFITIDIQCAAGSQYAYLGAMQVEGHFAAAEANRLAADSLDGPPLVNAMAWGIANGATGEMLWSKNPDQVRAMASTTKMMTALIVFELCQEKPERLKEVVSISKRADDMPGSTAAVKVGEKVVAHDLLFGLLLPSGNDAAIALAEHFGRYLPDDNGSIRNGSAAACYDRFVDHMNAKAAELGMKDTIYLAPHGNSGNRSTIRDLTKLAMFVLLKPALHEYFNTQHHSAEIVQPSGSKRIHYWKNTNELLDIEGFDGLKTGTTTMAGACLVATGVRNGDRLVVVILGSKRDSRFLDTRNLFRWGWTQRAAITRSGQ